jgi:hypothetical protein
MRRFHLGTAICLALAVPVLADEKDAKKEKLVQVGQIVGKLARVEGSQKYITLQVSQPILIPTIRGARMGRPIIGVRVQQITQNIELLAHDDLKVRMLQPPADFDDKGKPRRYSSKELQELKGPDPKLPGYSAEFDNLRPDQIVRVSVAKKSGSKQLVKPMLKTRKKDVDEENEDPAEETRPFAMMIVILQEPVR